MRRAGQRFHLDAGLVVHRDRAAHDGLVVLVHVDLDAAALEPERMTERDQLVRALGGHDARDDRRLEHGPLARRKPGLAQRRGDRGRKAHARLGDGRALRHGLAADVDHGRLRALIDVRERRHHPPM